MPSRRLVVLATFLFLPAAAAEAVDVHLGVDESRESCVRDQEWPEHRVCTREEDDVGLSAGAAGTRVAGASVGTTAQRETDSWMWDGSGSEETRSTSAREARADVGGREARVAYARCSSWEFTSHDEDDHYDSLWGYDSCTWGPDGVEVARCRGEQSRWSNATTGASYSGHACWTGQGVSHDGRGASVGAGHGASESCGDGACASERGSLVQARATVIPGREMGQDVWLPGVLP
jgi:hypothetical protein